MTRARYVSNPQAIDIPLTVSANLTANAVITVGNSSVNSVITSNTYSVGSNVSLSTSRLFLGNSTVNSVHTASTLDVGANVNLSTVGLNVGSNTVNAYINSTSFAIGNSTVNTAITSTTITSTALLSIGNTNVTGTANVSTGINVGANVNLSTSQINVGNSTVNTTITNITVSTNTVNVASIINVGANVNLSTSQINVGNSTVNTSITSTSLTTGNLTVSGNTTLGDASTDTVLMTGAPSIGGAGLGMGMGFRNRIINGDMRIDQRNAGASVTNTTNNLFAVDRWFTNLAGEYNNNVISQQNLDSLTPPANFKNYLGVKITTGTAAGASPFLSFRQQVEGYNIADAGYGTSSAQTLTCSFWARSNLVGTYAFTVRGGTPTRSYVTNFTINLADTWEFKTFVIPGDTDTGVVWESTIGAAFHVNIGLNSFQGVFSTSTLNQWHTGSFTGSTTQSNNFATTTGNAFYITGVQLEKGATATAFDYRDYGRELIMCQRYFQTITAAPGVGQHGSTTVADLSFTFRVDMRTTPTATPAGAMKVTDTSADYTQSSASISSFFGNATGGRAYLANFTGLTALRPYFLRTDSPVIQLSAEL